MLQRNSKPSGSFKWIRRVGAVLFVAEAAAFGVSYFLWSRLNTDRDFRRYMSTTCPILLDGYYSLGEYMNGSGPANSVRTIDAEYWRHDPKKSI